MALFRKTWLVLFYLQVIPAVFGFTVSDTSCTISPPNSTYFVSAPDTRGTLNILWSCLFTVFACTWAILHLNVPEQRGSKEYVEGGKIVRRPRDVGFLGDVRWKLKGFWTNFKWMMVTVLAPELILGKAMCDLAEAWSLSEDIKMEANQDQIPWGLTHSYYACMGGFVVRGPINKSKVVQETEAVTQTEADAIVGSDDIPSLVGCTKMTRPTEFDQFDILYHLDYGGVLNMRKGTYVNGIKVLPILKPLPYITEGEINEKSRSDVFSKVIAIGQVLWIAIEVISRFARGLSISQLEIATTALSACAVLTYIINIKKPQGIRTPTTVLCYTSVIPEQHMIIFHDWRTVSLLETFFGTRPTLRWPAPNVANDLIYFEKSHWFIAGLAVGGLVLGGIHIAAWNFVFPSQADRILWRTASVFSTVIIPITAALMFDESRRTRRRKWHRGGNTLNMGLSFLYVIARLVLLVEIFRTLFFLPPDAYIATWASNIPYVG